MRYSRVGFQSFEPVKDSMVSYLLEIPGCPTYQIFQGSYPIRDSRVSDVLEIPGFTTYQIFHGILTFRYSRVSFQVEIPGFPPIRESRVSYTFQIFQGFLTLRRYSRVSNLSKILGFPTYQRFQGFLLKVNENSSTDLSNKDCNKERKELKHIEVDYLILFSCIKNYSI